MNTQNVSFSRGYASRKGINHTKQVEKDEHTTCYTVGEYSGKPRDAEIQDKLTGINTLLGATHQVTLAK